MSAAAPATSEDEVTARVLELVAQETGYPTDLLDPDLDLEADLGIDTVKQAEVFAAIREHYGIERDEALKLRDYPTLRTSCASSRERQPQPAAAVAEPSPPQPEPAESPEPSEPEGASAFRRRVPVPVLRPPLDCCVATGVELAAGERVLLMPDRGGVAAALAGRLTQRGVEVLTIDGRPAVAELERRSPGGPPSGPIARRLLARGARRRGPARGARAERLARGTARAGQAARGGDAGAGRRRHRGPFLVAATRLGGRHGYDADGATSVIGGAVTRVPQGAGPRAPRTRWSRPSTSSPGERPP